MSKLQAGDIIELVAGMHVYADVPRHFIFLNQRGNFELYHAGVTLGGQFDYLCGRYVVTHTTHDGGGSAHNDSYPDGHHVWCRRLSDGKQVDFYQSGCFTAVIENIAPVGKAKLQWVEE